MKAAVMYGVDQPLVIEAVEVDEPRANEVLIRTSATGICHSDLHFMEGKYPMQCPAVLGHESAGIVEKIGDEVTNVQPGDRVVVAFVASCGHCDTCIQGRPFLCINTNRLGRPDRLSMKGEVVTQFAACPLSPSSSSSTPTPSCTSPTTSPWSARRSSAAAS